jgi:HAD superfamily hydrolase (TIGR01509 family)
MHNVRAVTLDYGQTLASLDVDFLAERLAEMRAPCNPARLNASLPDAWRAYDTAITQGEPRPWHVFMRSLVSDHIAAEFVDDIVERLWLAQPRRNLWRRPIEGMIELVVRLRRERIPVGIVSNSEGHLKELVRELGWGEHFSTVADSGELGFEKPDERIFLWTCERLGVSPSDAVHVGDSWAADVVGATNAGLQAIWFQPEGRRSPNPQVISCRNAEELDAALGTWFSPPPGRRPARS